MSQYCMYCAKDMSKWNLDFSRDIVCDDCTQKLVGGKELPEFRPQKPRTARKVRHVGKVRGDLPT